jgi:hypothetical protein
VNARRRVFLSSTRIRGRFSILRDLRPRSAPIATGRGGGRRDIEEARRLLRPHPGRGSRAPGRGPWCRSSLGSAYHAVALHQALPAKAEATMRTRRCRPLRPLVTGMERRLVEPLDRLRPQARGEDPPRSPPFMSSSRAGRRCGACRPRPCLAHRDPDLAHQADCIRRRRDARVHPTVEDHRTFDPIEVVPVPPGVLVGERGRASRGS